MSGLGKEYRKEIERLTADNDNLRNTITSMQLSLKSDGERIAKLEATLRRVATGSGANGYVKRVALEALRKELHGFFELLWLMHPKRTTTKSKVQLCLSHCGEKKQGRVDACLPSEHFKDHVKGR